MMSKEGNFQAKEITDESLHMLFNDPCTKRKQHFVCFGGGGGGGGHFQEKHVKWL